VPSPALPLLLIVEDNLDVTHYLTSCLQNHYRLLYARNGREGIGQARKFVPDIIISDVMMPEVDGFELSHTLKTDERTSHIPIILLTAKADMDSKLQGLETGADAYLVKPFVKRELLIRLDKLVELRRSLQQRYQQLGPLTPTEDTRLKREDQFLQKVRQAIEDNLDNEDFKVKDLYRAVGVSRIQLYRKLNALTGRTPADVIQTIRLQRARRLLLQTDMLVGEVAARVGFKDHSHFTKLYKEAFGELPSQAGSRE
jgi:YesN/AraC family two-component response regulator